MVVFRDLDIFDSLNYVFYFYISIGKATVNIYAMTSSILEELCVKWRYMYIF